MFRGLGRERLAMGKVCGVYVPMGVVGVGCRGEQRREEGWFDTALFVAGMIPR